MSQRYATIIKGNDGEEIVSAIAQVEGAPPEARSENAKVQKVADGVLIGMVKGGPVDAVGGFGFPEGTAGSQGRSPGVVKADTKEAAKSKAATE